MINYRILHQMNQSGTSSAALWVAQGHRENRFPPWVLIRSHAELAPSHGRPASGWVMNRVRNAALACTDAIMIHPVIQ
jgi:hypothetical protein